MIKVYSNKEELVLYYLNHLEIKRLSKEIDRQQKETTSLIGRLTAYMDFNNYLLVKEAS